MPWSMSTQTRAFIKGKMKDAQNEKRKKLLGFSFYIDIGNFEAFLWNLNLSAKHVFWRCGQLEVPKILTKFIKKRQNYNMKKIYMYLPTFF